MKKILSILILVICTTCKKEEMVWDIRDSFIGNYSCTVYSDFRTCDSIFSFSYSKDTIRIFKNDISNIIIYNSRASSFAGVEYDTFNATKAIKDIVFTFETALGVRSYIFGKVINDSIHIKYTTDPGCISRGAFNKIYTGIKI